MGKKRICHFEPKVAEKCQLRIEMAGREKQSWPFRGQSGSCYQFFENGTPKEYPTRRLLRPQKHPVTESAPAQGTARPRIVARASYSRTAPVSPSRKILRVTKLYTMTMAVATIFTMR